MSTSIHPFHECECSVCQQSDSEIVPYHRRINVLLSRLNEPQRRWYVAVLSQDPGAPSAVQLSLITGLDEKSCTLGYSLTLRTFAM